MIDLLGILTQTWFGLTAPAPVQPHLASAPLMAAPAATASPSAAEIVDDIQKFYANLKDVAAQFRQEVSFKQYGGSKSSDGKVWLSKPGKMRWDYYETKPDKSVWTKKSFISDGTTLYVVEHDNKQVAKKSLQQDLMPVAVTFLFGKGDLKTEFTAELDKSTSYGDGKSDLVVKLTPKQPSAQYKNLYLVVNKDDFHVKESIIVDSSDNVNHFKFFAPDFKAQIEPTWFQFNPSSVKNYRVIDGDAPQKPAPTAQGPAPAPAPSKP